MVTPAAKQRAKCSAGGVRLLLGGEQDGRFDKSSLPRCVGVRAI